MASRVTRNFLEALVSGASNALRKNTAKKEEQRLYNLERSRALQEEKERRARALKYDQEDYKRKLKRKDKEYENKKTRLLKEGQEEELARGALSEGSSQALNSFLSNIPGGLTKADLEAQLLGDSNNSEALKKEILKHRSNYWKNKSEAVKPGNEDYGFKPDNSFIEKTLNEGQRAILPLVSGAAQMTAGAFPPIAGNVFQEQEGPGKGTSEASFRELKQIRDETIKVISQIRDKYENETGTFDLSKIEPADKYRYQEALDIYQKSVAQMQEIGKEKLGMNQGNQVGNSEVVSKFLDFSKKVRGLLKPPERNVVKRTRAK